MPAIAAEQRDWDVARAGFAAWFSARWPAAERVRVGPLTVNRSNGFSSESVFLDVVVEERGEERHRSLVARLPPLGGGLFPVYDLETQWLVQDVVGAHGIPVASQLGFEPDESWVGSPFVMMERVAGRVPTDNPLYCVDGWLRDAAPAEQRQVCTSAIDTLAEVHRLDWRELGLSRVGRAGGPGLVGELAWWAGYLDWASEGAPPAALADALGWCRVNWPDAEPPASLLWGDARLGNLVIGDDLQVAAVLDWEMTSIGPAEVDLGWFTATRAEARALAGGIADPELPGLLSRGETVERYEQRLGRPIDDLRWYEVFAMLRWGTCIVAVQRLLRRMGVSDHFILDAPVLSDWVADIMESPSYA